MNNWRRFRKICLYVLVALTAINFFALFVIVPRGEISLDSFFIVTAALSFILLILTINIGGKYVLYIYLFLLSFVINATIGARAGMVGEISVVNTSLIISAVSLFLLLLCIAILLIRNRKLKSRD